MPPFNFGQTFNESLQASLNRGAQQRRQRAQQQLQMMRLRQQAEQARQNRIQDQRQFEARQDFLREKFNEAQKPQQITIEDPSRYDFIEGEGAVQMTPTEFQTKANLHLAKVRNQRGSGGGQQPTLPLEIGGKKLQVPVTPQLGTALLMRKYIKQPKQGLDPREYLELFLPNLKAKGGTGGSQSGGGQTGTSQPGTGGGTQGTPQPQGAPEPDTPFGNLMSKVGDVTGWNRVMENPFALGGVFTASFSEKDRQGYNQEAVDIITGLDQLENQPAAQQRLAIEDLKERVSTARQNLQEFEQTEQVKRMIAKYDVLANLFNQLQGGQGRTSPAKRKLYKRLVKKTLEADTVTEMAKGSEEIRMVEEGMPQ